MEVKIGSICTTFLYVYTIQIFCMFSPNWYNFTNYTRTVSFSSHPGREMYDFFVFPMDAAGFPLQAVL